MTSEPRHLAFTAHPIFPRSFSEQREWSIEKAIELASDYSEPGMIAVAAVTCGWTREQLAQRVDHLCDLADEVADAEANGPTARWHAAVDEYKDALHAIASGPIFEHGTEALAIVAEPTGLRIVR